MRRLKCRGRQRRPLAQRLDVGPIGRRVQLLLLLLLLI